MIQEPMRHAAIFLLAVLLIGGCASESTRPDAAVAGTDTGGNKVVERRALERWGYLINRQAEKAYDYLSPGFRATKSREEYAGEMNNRPVHWTKVMPYRQICEKPDVCVVDLQIDADAKMVGTKEMVSSVGFVTETWIKSGGKWWFLPSAKAATGSK